MRIIAIGLAAILMLAAAAGAQAQSAAGRDNPLLNSLTPAQAARLSQAARSGAATAAQQPSGGASTAGQSLILQSPSMPTVAPTAVPPPGAVNIASGGSSGGSILTSDGLRLPVFGTDLFTGSFAGTRPGDRPDYQIQRGDQIAINLYGAVNTGGVQTVDASGQVFIPNVGPVAVAGVTVARLQAVIASAVHGIYTGSVGVYATVAQAGSIGVYVTGDVVRPGRYQGGARDNVLYFLSSAGGIDPSRGSFRNITVKRGGEVVATYDLYDFRLGGKTQAIKFEDGDVVFVAPRGAMVGVTGLARNDFAFEAPSGARSLTGADLIPLARPEPVATNAALHGFRGGEPQAAYYPLADFARVILSDGDHVDFRSDAYAQSMSVVISGDIKGPSVYVLPRGAKLSQLMAQIPLEGTDVEPRYVHVQRLEVAMEQKRALQDALFNLQKQVLTATPVSADAAALVTAQASLVNQFVDRAQSIQPDGNIAVHSNGRFQDITLQDGDVVVLPNRSDAVIVTGEVLNPGGLAHADNLTIRGYVDRAGGYAAHANKKRFVLRSRDGSAEVASANTVPQPGDEIVVLPKVANLTFQLVKDITQIMFQIALTASSVKNVGGL